VVPAESVGGDFFLLARLDRDRTGVLIGDVSGHGYQSALIMALALSAAGIHVQAAFDPSIALEAVHRSLRDELGAAIHEQLFDASTGTYRNGTQTAQLLPLAFGITPTDRREAVFQALVADLEKRGGALSTGMTGTRFLLPVLSAGGRHDLALALATRTTFPSWGHWMAKGATTMAETWDAWDIPQDQLRLRSFNHPNYGSIGEWFFESLGGLQPDEDHPGFEHFFVRPQAEGPLMQADVAYRSVRGWIRSAWKKENGRLEMRVEVPAGTTATIRVPGREVSADNGADMARTEPRASFFQVGAGNHTFRSFMLPDLPDDHGAKKRSRVRGRFL
jgi:alpha-L-rhamnosidase